MKKKIIPVLIAIVLIIVVFGIAFGGKIIDRYSYSKERADLNEIYAMQDETDTAIVLQDEIIEQRAKLLDGTYYVALSTFLMTGFMRTQEKDFCFIHFPKPLLERLSEHAKSVSGRRTRASIISFPAM